MHPLPPCTTHAVLSPRPRWRVKCTPIPTAADAIAATASA